MATLKDIAAEVGVSISVVSRTLNPNPDKNAYVSQELQQRIRQAAESLGFKPNRHAEFLKRGRNPSIGVFIPEIPNRLVADLMFGISHGAAAHGFPLCFHFGRTFEEYGRFIESAGYSGSGIITYPFEDEVQARIPELLDEFRARGGCMVVISNAPGCKDVPTVCHDDARGGWLAAQRLLERKCQVFLAQDGRFTPRTEGFNRCLEERGIASIPFALPDFERVFSSVAGTPARPVGIFAIADEDAFAILAILRRRRMQIGSEVLVIGYDDLGACRHSVPPLTTIHQDFKQQGMLAVDNLVKTIYDRQVQNVLVEPWLVVRETA